MAWAFVEFIGKEPHLLNLIKEKDELLNNMYVNEMTMLRRAVEDKDQIDHVRRLSAITMEFVARELEIPLIEFEEEQEEEEAAGVEEEEEKVEE